MSCTNCLNTKINPCVNEIYVDLSLTASTSYIVIVTDHFGNEYYATVETDGDGAFYIYMDNSYEYTDSDFPDGLFSNPITFAITTIDGDPVEFESGANTYDCFTTEPTSNRGENVIELENYPVVIEGECCFEITGTPYYLAMFNDAGDNVEDSAIWQETAGTVNNFWLFSPDGNNNGIITIGDLQEDSGINMGIGATSLFSVGNLNSVAGVYVGESVHYAQMYSDEINNVAGLELYWEDGLGDSCMVNMFNDNGLQIISTDDKSVIFSQASQDGNIEFLFNSDTASTGVIVNGSLGAIELRSSAITSRLNIQSDSSDSYVDIYIKNDDTESYIVLGQAAALIFKANIDGISTEGTNFWKLGAASAGAPTADSKIRVTINGVDYDIAAQTV